MQVLKGIKYLAIALIAAFAMTVAPAAASQPSHACYMDGAAMAAHTGFMHSGAMQAGHTMTAGHMQMQTGKHCPGCPNTCQAQCGITTAPGTALLTAASVPEPARPVTRPLYHVAPVTVSPVSPKLHTPPPRPSLFV